MDENNDFSSEYAGNAAFVPDQQKSKKYLKQSMARQRCPLS